MPIVETDHAHIISECLPHIYFNLSFYRFTYLYLLVYIGMYVYLWTLFLSHFFVFVTLVSCCFICTYVNFKCENVYVVN